MFRFETYTLFGDNMEISFFGHRNIRNSDAVGNKLAEVLEREFGQEEVDFYIGAYGAFDFIALKKCVEFKRVHKNARIFFVTAYLDEGYLQDRDFITELCDGVLFPDLENVPKKYAIPKRNQCVVDMSRAVICYLENNTWGGAAKAVDYALKQKKTVINIGSIDVEKYFQR